jgi:CRISPR/Cas system-associated endonuclease Cas1
MQTATISTSVSEPRTLSPEDVADSAAALARTYRRPDTAGVCVVDGFGVRVVVERGALEVHDGIGQHRRTRRYDRATHRLRRLVILNAAGTVSLEALRWCQALGIGVLVLGPDGTAHLASTPRMTDDARLRRTEALAPTEPYGLDVAQWLISRKLVGQGKLVLRRFGDTETAETIGNLALAVEEASTIDEIRQLEASAAALYFGAWSGRPECGPMFAVKDRRRIPPHWSRYEGRRSVLTSGNGNRKAERPVNALLNYVYALVEAEAILACQAVGLDAGLGLVHSDTRGRQAVGLDAGLGLVHSDTRGRQSLALDIMEPVRPEVDAFVLGIIERRTFRKVEFTETSDGHVRLRSPLTHELAETLPQWAQSLGPIAEHVAHVFGKAMDGKYQAATPLTRDRTKAAQAIVKARKQSANTAAKSSTSRQKPVSAGAPTLWSCPDCGGAVSNRLHVRCEACIEADPRQTPEIRGRRAAAISARKRALTEWELANPGVTYDPELFRREILPRLRMVKLSDIVEAIGCSKASASDIRRGKRTPHVSTWGALGELVAFRTQRRRSADIAL